MCSCAQKKAGAYLHHSMYAAIPRRKPGAKNSLGGQENDAIYVACALSAHASFCLKKKRMPNTFDLYLHAFSASWAPIAPLAAPETGW